jgi:hypothetical protein
MIETETIAADEPAFAGRRTMRKMLFDYAARF